MNTRLKNKVEGFIEQVLLGIIDFDTATENMIEMIEEEINLTIEPLTRQPRQGDEEPKPSIHFIQRYVAEAYHIDISHLSTHCRKREYVQARQCAMYLCTELCDKLVSLKTIGKEFGGRDHSTVIYSKKTMEDHIEVYQYVAIRVLEIRKKIITKFKETLV